MIRSSFYKVVIISFSVVSISGCIGQVKAKPDTLQRSDLINTSVAGTLAALSATPPVLSSNTPNPTLTPSPTWDFVLAPTTEALQIDLPTPGPLPVLAWRPPLYQVPWALTEKDHFYFQRPIAANEINWPVADYRYGGVFFGPDVVHTGVDIAAPSDTPVLAAASGKVVWAGYGLLAGVENQPDAYGKAIAIRHDIGYEGKRLFTVYAHLNEVTVQDNQYVQAGDQIGKVGGTGETTGPHLHFEIRLEKNLFFNTRNPELWMAPPQGWGVLVGRIMDDKGKLLTHTELHVESKDTDREWSIRTYGGKIVNSDDNYNENLVLSDLPAGNYLIWVDFEDTPKYHKFVIYPGAVTYLTFSGKDGFQAQATPTPAADFLPTVMP